MPAIVVFTKDDLAIAACDCIAENGHLAVFLANYIDQPVEFKYHIDPAKFGLKGKRFALKEIRPEGSASEGIVAGTGQRTETLGPRRIEVMGILPAGE
jgi:hypothetical protein